MFSTITSVSSLSDGMVEPITGSSRFKSTLAALKLTTSMKKVINWNTMSRIGVRFGSARSPELLPDTG